MNSLSHCPWKLGHVQLVRFNGLEDQFKKNVNKETRQGKIDKVIIFGKLAPLLRQANRVSCSSMPSGSQ